MKDVKFSPMKLLFEYINNMKTLPEALLIQGLNVTITYESTVLKKPKRNVSEESCVSKSKPAECFKSSKAKVSV